ncbi:MAG: cupin domain-containing protein [Pseudomonadota bacterium]
MKPHREFFAIDESAWLAQEGYPAGFEIQVLSDDLDPATRRGSRTVLQRIAPGAATDGALTHEECEEVFVWRGDLVAAGERFEAPAYACRPGGVPHGPFRSEGGCLLLAVFYYADGP